MKNEEMTKKQLKDIDIFVNWIQDFFKLNAFEKEQMIEQTQEEYFKKYLNKIKYYDENEQAEEINFLKYGE